MVVSLVEIGGMQHYNEDLESDPPASFTQFRQRIGAAGVERAGREEVSP